MINISDLQLDKILFENLVRIRVQKFGLERSVAESQVRAQYGL